MKTFGFSISFAFVVLSLPLYASASPRKCSAGLTNHPVQFESTLQYDDMRSKANPTVHVLINGKPAKMMLDSGSNSHSLWDASLLDEMPSRGFKRLDAIVGSADARTVDATLADGHGRSIRQEFYVLNDSALAGDGYAGILSPQSVAGLNALVMDFERNCFFTSPPFDIDANNGAYVGRGTTIQNPHDVMAISVDLDGRNVPVIIDSGASTTLIQASLLVTNPEGQKSPRVMDIFKAELPNPGRMRLVDLTINGQLIKSLPVIPRQTKDDKVVENVGYIGMDVLKDRVIYYHGARQELNFLTRPPGATYTGIEPEATTQ